MCRMNGIGIRYKLRCHRCGGAGADGPDGRGRRVFVCSVCTTKRTLRPEPEPRALPPAGDLYWTDLS